MPNKSLEVHFCQEGQLTSDFTQIRVLEELM